MENQNIAQSVAAVQAYFSSGKTKPIETRMQALRALRKAITTHSDEIYSALQADLHKSPSESYLTEVSIVLHEIDDHLRHLRRWTRPRRVSTPLAIMPARSRIICEPLGTVLIIAPWNYPFQLIFAPLVGAISAGNCAILKPSEYVPNVNRVIAQIIKESFTESYVTLIEGGREENQALLALKFDYIFFTGSPALGHVVMEAAAKNLTPVTLELGGKSPCIVDSDADIELAARRIIWGKLLNAGQTCIAPDYLFLHRDIYDRFIPRAVYYIHKFFGRDPKLSPDYPRIINDNAMSRLLEAMQSSGSIIYGGESDPAQRYLSPTLIATPDDASQLMTEEIFGPLLPIKSFSHIDEVVSYVNARPKPLALYYFGSKRSANDVLQRTSSGGACINDTIVHIANHHLPFGGVGNSGMGRYHSHASFLLMSNHRSVVWSSTKVDIPMRYAPYIAIKWLRKFI